VTGPLVSTGWLASQIGAPDLRVVDVRWYLDPTKRGRDGYLSGHIPGAVFLDIDADLAAPGGGRGAALGRHPWPGAEQVARVMSDAGIGAGTRVVAYDDAAGAMAVRLWYVLRAHGHDAVAVLDGGLVKWQAEGRPLDASVPRPLPARFEPRPREGLVVTKAELRAQLLSDAPPLLLDARAPERFRGESEPIDLRAGHIPGSRNAPYALNLTAGPAAVFLPGEALRRRYAALGAEEREPIVYCGSGVTACHDLLALELAGLRGRLYAGSWSEWSADEALPIETGEPR
jgi:thiosulfate/3-mercaptopyruvate sulfurtransferase